MSAYTISAYDLGFRAACNAAIAESKRPLRRRVIERLETSYETQKLIEQLGPLSSTAPGNSVFDLLAKDPRWQTLVAETVANTRGWGALPAKDGFWGKLLAILQSVIGSDDKPATRLVVAAVASASVGGLSGYKLAELQPPDPLDMKVKVTAQGTEIPVSFVLPKAVEGVSIPVRVDLQAKPQPLVVDVSADVGDAYKKEMGRIAAQLRQANATLDKLAQKPASDGAQLATLEEIASHLRDVSELQQQVVKEIPQFSQQLQNVVAGGAGQRYEVNVDEGHPRILLVQSLHPTNLGYRKVNVELCLKSVSRPNGHAGVVYSIGEAGTQGSCSSNPWKKLVEGVPEQVSIGVDNWMVAVHSVKRRFGQGRATFSLRPDVPILARRPDGPEPRDAATANTTD